MKDLIKEIRIALGEVLLGWALDVMPPSGERRNLAELVLRYTRAVVPVTIPKRQRETRGHSPSLVP